MSVKKDKLLPVKQHKFDCQTLTNSIYFFQSNLSYYSQLTLYNGPLTETIFSSRTKIFNRNYEKYLIAFTRQPILREKRRESICYFCLFRLTLCKKQYYWKRESCLSLSYQCCQVRSLAIRQ